MQTQTPPKHTDALSLSLSLSLTHTHTYTCMKAYLALDGRMQSLPDFESVLLDDEIMLAGADAKVLTEENGDRRAKHRNNFIRRMELSERCKVYSYNPNGGKVALRWIYRIPYVYDSGADTQETQLTTELGKHVPMYYSRRHRAEVMARFSGVTRCTKAIIRSMHRCLTCDDSAAHDKNGNHE